MSNLTVGYLGSLEGLRAIEDVFPSSFSIIDVDPEDPAATKLLAQSDAIVDASMRFAFSSDFFDSAGNLKIISTATTGSDHIDHGAAAQRSVRILTLKDHAEVLHELTPAAEMTWTLVMALARNLTHAVEHVEEGLWRRELFPGVMLKGKVFGLIGCGRIGSWVARYANAFGMDVIGFDPYRNDEIEGIKKVAKIDIARDADFVSVHVHLNGETSGLIDEAFLGSMKSSAFLINTSRGAIVDEVALLKSLENRKIAGYGCDVLSSEPNVGNDPLIRHLRTNNNIIITPHCGGNSPDAVRVVCAHAARQVEKFFRTNG